MKNLSPIKLVPAREMVAVRLREAIMLRELKEGDEITLDGIAQQLNVSITPVREAFQILESDSLIKRRPNKSAIVLGMSRKNIIDHYEARSILESEAAALACKKDADISKLIEIHEKTGELLKIGNTEEYSNYNHIFHFEIWKASGMIRLEQYYRHSGMDYPWIRQSQRLNMPNYRMLSILKLLRPFRARMLRKQENS